MALTSTEEAQVRLLLGEQAAILSLAGNEATITSKLGATKVTLSDLASASLVNSADLFLLRQGSTDRSVTAQLLQSKLTSFKADYLNAVVRPYVAKMGDTLSVKDFGAVGDGVADDTAAIQLAFDDIAAKQAPTIGSWMTTCGHLHFPQGIYKITGAIKARGYIVITGVGTGYVAGSTIRQHAASTDIFQFYGETASHRNLGTCVAGINFEFAATTGDRNGFAMKYPYLSDVDGLAMSSNSHYIRDCRFGGFHRYGRFLYVEASNDIEVSGNVIDVCLDGHAAIQFGTQSRTEGCSDIRMSRNNFFACDVGIWVVNSKSVAIGVNNFSNSSGIGAAIKLSTDTASETAGMISGVTISNNSFWAQRTSLNFSGSASNVIYSNNVHVDCLDIPLAGNGISPHHRYKITGNSFHLANNFGTGPTTYSRTEAPLRLEGAQMFNSEICDNKVDANGLNTVTHFANDQTAAGSFGSGMTLRNNTITNNTSPPGAYKCFVPTTSNDLVIESKATSVGYPTNLAVLNFQTAGIPVDSHFTFDVDFEVKCDQPGTNVGVRTGRVRASVSHMALAGPPKSDITVISSIGDDYNGAGGGAIPAVTFGFVMSPNPSLLITITGSLVTPDVTIKCKALNFRASGNAQIRSA